MAGLAVTLAIIAGFLAAMALLSLWAARELPESGSVPTHFDIRGKADGFGSRWVTLSIMPAVYVAIAAFVIAVTRLAPPQPAAGLLVTHLFTGASLLAAHALVMGLLLNWARNRP